MSSIAITGMGVISPAGTNLFDFWTTLESGAITYKVIEEFKNNNNFRIKIGSRLEDNSWQAMVPDQYRKNYGKASQYCIVASISALKNAAIDISELQHLRVAVVLSTTMGEIQVEEEVSLIEHKKGKEKVPQNLLSKYSTDNIISALSDYLNISGPSYMIPAACAGGNFAVSLGKRLLEWDKADIVIAGGLDVFSRVAFTGFQRILSLTPDFCKPFDRFRKGLVLGEGCGIVILEKSDSAKARKAKIYGEIIGAGLSSDRYHMTSPHPDGDGAARAMKYALREAKLLPCDINYISAHGTGTVANDKIEVKALKEVFGPEKIPPISSIKSMIGHSMGAAGAIELIACLQMIQHNTILPTLNYSCPDPECNVDCVPNVARKTRLDCVISNSFGFGGQSSSIIVKRE